MNVNGTVDLPIHSTPRLLSGPSLDISPEMTHLFAAAKMSAVRECAHAARGAKRNCRREAEWVRARDEYAELLLNSCLAGEPNLFDRQFFQRGLKLWQPRAGTKKVEKAR
jgi:hypothetical protein